MRSCDIETMAAFCLGEVRVKNFFKKEDVDEFSQQGVLSTCVALYLGSVTRAGR